jgi:hypothetical protein
MARVTFTVADVARVLALPDTQAVENLIERRVLEISAYTRRGRPLFDADAVRRAAARVLTEGAGR